MLWKMRQADNSQDPEHIGAEKVMNNAVPEHQHPLPDSPISHPDAFTFQSSENIPCFFYLGQDIVAE